MSKSCNYFSNQKGVESGGERRKTNKHVKVNTTDGKRKIRMKKNRNKELVEKAGRG